MSVQQENKSKRSIDESSNGIAMHGAAPWRVGDDHKESHPYSRSFDMRMQKVSLDTPVSPFLPGTIAPFARNTQKRAFTSALYYSECYLNGIQPVDADEAAIDARNRYNKWWISVKFKGDETDTKRRKLLEQQQQQQQEPRNTLAFQQGDGRTVVSEDESNLSKATAASQERETPCIREVTLQARYLANEITSVKSTMIADLRDTNGDTNTTKFHSLLNILQSYYFSRGYDSRWDASGKTPFSLDNTWFAMTRPTYSESLGCEDGDLTYTLGRLSFDMFRPTTLKCSVQGVYNRIELSSKDRDGYRPKTFPRSLLLEGRLRKGKPPLRNYDIIASITILPKQTRQGETTNEKEGYSIQRPIKALIRNHGYCLPDPNVRNRFTIWFSGGALELNDEEDLLKDWKELFDEKDLPNRSVGEYARKIASKLLLGAHIPDCPDENGTLSYTLNRPIGGHGSVFIDDLYSDDSTRIVRGHHGSIFVFIRSS